MLLPQQRALSIPSILSARLSSTWCHLACFLQLQRTLIPHVPFHQPSPPPFLTHVLTRSCPPPPPKHPNTQFQLVNMESMRLTPNTTLAPYFENGDYHDTIMLPQIFFDFTLVGSLCLGSGLVNGRTG